MRIAVLADIHVSRLEQLPKRIVDTFSTVDMIIHSLPQSGKGCRLFWHPHDERRGKRGDNQHSRIMSGLAFYHDGAVAHHPGEISAGISAGGIFQ